MNIFYLDHDPLVAAHYHNNRHVVKMVTESTQLLSTCKRIKEGKKELVYLDNKLKEVYVHPTDMIIGTKNNRKIINPVLYLQTHINHPSNKWIREGSRNYEYVFNLLVYLLEEYSYRFNKTGFERSRNLLQELSTCSGLSNTGTDIKLAMDREFILSDPVESYRNYYRKAKYHLADWGKRGEPYWWKF